MNTTVAPAQSTGIDPINLIIAIAGLVGIGATFLLNIYQSIKSRHCESDCGLCGCFYSSEHKDKNEDNN